MAAYRIGIHALAVDAETLREFLGGLSHRQTDHRIGQAA